MSGTSAILPFSLHLVLGTCKGFTQGVLKYHNEDVLYYDSLFVVAATFYGKYPILYVTYACLDSPFKSVNDGKQQAAHFFKHTSGDPYRDGAEWQTGLMLREL